MCGWSWTGSSTFLWPACYCYRRLIIMLLLFTSFGWPWAIPRTAKVVLVVLVCAFIAPIRLRNDDDENCIPRSGLKSARVGQSWICKQLWRKIAKQRLFIFLENFRPLHNKRHKKTEVKSGWASWLVATRDGFRKFRKSSDKFLEKKPFLPEIILW